MHKEKANIFIQELRKNPNVDTANIEAFQNCISKYLPMTNCRIERGILVCFGSDDNQWIYRYTTNTREHYIRFSVSGKLGLSHNSGYSWKDARWYSEEY